MKRVSKIIETNLVCKFCFEIPAMDQLKFEFSQSRQKGCTKTSFDEFIFRKYFVQKNKVQKRALHLM